MKLEHKTVNYKNIVNPHIEIKYINDLLYDACIWGHVGEYLKKDSKHERDNNINRENKYLEYFRDIDAYAMSLLLLKREYSKEYDNKIYSLTDLSRELFAKNDTRRTQKIVESGVHFGFFNLDYDKNKISRVIPTEKLKEYFKEYIYPNIRYC